MSRLYRFACTFVGLSAGYAFGADAPVLPDDTWYRVEVIVFERTADVDPASTQEIVVSHAPRAYPLDVIAFDDEANRSAAYPLDAETRAQPALPASKPNRPAQPQTQSQAMAPVTPSAAERAAKLVADYQAELQGRSYKFEPSSTFLLGAEDGRLQRSNVYHVVFHRAWIQPVPDRDQLRPMLIQIRDRADSVARIEGFLGITRGRYLHIDARLWYAVNANQTAIEAEEPSYMELREQRRMRSGELHYLDHPKFGVLARVDPIQPPETLLAELARLGAPQPVSAVPAQ
jgi:hypothetical protein